MMRTTLAIAAFLLAWPGTPGRASLPPDQCPGFPAGRALQADADRFYAGRAVEIVRAGSAGDRARLTAMIAPDFGYVVRRGDAFMSSGKIGAVEAALSLARQLKADRFEMLSVYPGPFLVLPASCEWSVTVFFRSGTADNNIRVTFKFADGLLKAAQGEWVMLFEGPVG